MVTRGCDDGRVLAAVRCDLTAVRPPLMSVRTTVLLLAPVWAGFLAGAVLRRPVDGLLVAPWAATSFSSAVPSQRVRGYGSSSSPRLA